MDSITAPTNIKGCLSSADQIKTNSDKPNQNKFQFKRISKSN